MATSLPSMTSFSRALQEVDLDPAVRNRILDFQRAFYNTSSSDQVIFANQKRKEIRMRRLGRLIINKEDWLMGLFFQAEGFGTRRDITRRFEWKFFYNENKTQFSEFQRRDRGMADIKQAWGESVFVHYDWQSAATDHIRALAILARKIPDWECACQIMSVLSWQSRSGNTVGNSQNKLNSQKRSSMPQTGEWGQWPSQRKRDLLHTRHLEVFNQEHLNDADYVNGLLSEWRNLEPLWREGELKTSFGLDAFGLLVRREFVNVDQPPRARLYNQFRVIPRNEGKADAQDKDNADVSRTLPYQIHILPRRVAPPSSWPAWPESLQAALGKASSKRHIDGPDNALTQSFRRPKKRTKTKEEDLEEAMSRFITSLHKAFPVENATSAYLLTLMEEILTNPGVAGTWGESSKQRIRTILEAIQPPANAGEKCKIVDLDRARCLLENTIVDAPLFTKAPILCGSHEFSRRVDFGPEFRVNVHAYGRPSHENPVESRRLQRFWDQFGCESNVIPLNIPQEEQDQESEGPLCLGLLNPWGLASVPSCFAQEDWSMLNYLQDSFVNEPHSQEVERARWKETCAWSIVSQGGYHMTPRIYASGFSTWMHIQDGHLVLGWLAGESDISEWTMDQNKTSGWQFRAMVPGDVVFLPRGTPHMMLRSECRKSITFGGHVLKWSDMVGWLKHLAARGPHQPGHKVKEMVDCAVKLVKHRLARGYVDAMGGRKTVDEFLALAGRKHWWDKY